MNDEGCDSLSSRTSAKEPQFFSIHALDWAHQGDVRLLHGLESKLISHDAVTGASTSMARLPASWSQTHGDEEATLELFVCEGDLSVEGAEVGAGGYAFVPRGAGCDLGSTGGAQALVFSNPRWRPLGGRRFT